MHQAYVPRRVWDLPTRLFHWFVVVLGLASWVTQHQGWIRPHMLCGYAMMVALLFRLVWGVIGSDTARFAWFVTSPAAAFRYLAEVRRGDPNATFGHNAAGGWMVLLMLALLCIQVGTGLCANDEVSAEGPLARLVGPGNSDWLSHLHAVNFRLIIAAVALHVAAVVVYALLLGHSLVRPMISGRKLLPASVPPPAMAGAAKAVVTFCVAACAVALLVFRFGK